MTIDQKRQLFIKEIGNRPLTAEQQKIFNTFAYNKSKSSKFTIADSYGNKICFLIATTNHSDGVLHILGKHYKGKIGEVTAMDIIHIGDVIRKGKISYSQKGITYKLDKKDKTYTLILGLKPLTNGGNILKSFYSNK